MTKGGSNKHNMLGRLIFGEKRKQHASPSRHRSTTRNGGNVADVSPSRGGVANKNPINVHDWAIWRMHLNEQMENGMSDQTDLKQLKQFLHSNPFYQQHSRDPSNGRYNGVRLLFSIPHAKLKSELNDGSRGVPNKSSNIDVGDTTTFDQNNVHPNIDDRTAMGVNSIAAGPPRIIDKTISQLLPKNLIGNKGGFLHPNEQMVATDTARIRCSMRASYTASDRVHSTLQKAVKDGNVLEKIKAFEMQAAAAQAELTPKLGGGVNNIINNRMQTVTSSIQSTAHRALSPTMLNPIQHPISPMPIQPELHQQQQYIRSHRGRYVHPVQPRHDGHLGPIITRESRKGAHVLEPAHGDIILRRATPSQKTVNDEDYSITAITSLALTPSQGHHSRQHHHHHHRSSVSRSRHRQEAVHDKRSSSHHDNAHKKHQQKQKEPTTSSSNKTSTRRRWLKGRKEVPTETATENSKQDASTNNKSSKKNKNKKKNAEKEKLEATKKATSPEPKGKTSSTSDNNRVYGVPNTTVNEQSKTEAISPQPPSRIDEENESDREEEEKNIETEINHVSPKEKELTQHKECDTITTTNVEQQPSTTKYHQKLSSTDGEVISKIDEDTRFSRPTDDHAHRSDLNDEDDECKSEGDVFIDESSATTINLQQSSNVIRRHSSQCSAEQLTSDRRWQWSKETSGLIEKSNRKKKQQPITIVTRKNEINQENEEEQIVYEIPQSEQNQTLKLKNQPSLHSITPTEINIESNNNKPIGKQILHAIINSKNNQEQTKTDEFFENGPHTNPEETIVNKTSTA